MQLQWYDFLPELRREYDIRGRAIEGKANLLRLHSTCQGDLPTAVCRPPNDWRSFSQSRSRLTTHALAFAHQQTLIVVVSATQCFRAFFSKVLRLQIETTKSDNFFGYFAIFRHVRELGNRGVKRRFYQRVIASFRLLSRLTAREDVVIRVSFIFIMRFPGTPEHSIFKLCHAIRSASFLACHGQKRGGPVSTLFPSFSVSSTLPTAAITPRSHVTPCISNFQSRRQSLFP